MRDVIIVGKKRDEIYRFVHMGKSKKKWRMRERWWFGLD
jgi:hypothetical protein